MPLTLPDNTENETRKLNSEKELWRKVSGVSDFLENTRRAA